MNSVQKANDLLRTTMIVTQRNQVFLTPAVVHSPHREAVITAVRNFNDFNASNDPHSEHDFGAVSVGNEQFFWKIDYYDDTLEYGADPHEGPVVRVLTIMRSDEY